MRASIFCFGAALAIATTYSAIVIAQTSGKAIEPPHGKADVKPKPSGEEDVKPAGKDDESPPAEPDGKPAGKDDESPPAQSGTKSAGKDDETADRKPAGKGGLASAKPAGKKNSPPATPAQRLHNEGLAHKAQGEYQLAYEKFEQSLKLRNDSSTRFRLAQCAEHLGKLATALRNYRRAANLAHKNKRPKRKQFALKAAALVEPRLSTLTIVVTKAARKIIDLRVQLTDSQGISTKLKSQHWGQPARLDGGAYTLKATAPGYTPWTQTVELRNELHHTRVVVPTLKPQAQALESKSEDGPVTPPAAIKPTPVLRPLPKPDDTIDADNNDGMLFGGIISTLTGVAMLGGGAALVAVGERRYNSTIGPPYCSLNDYCNQEGLDRRAQSRIEAISGVVLGSAGIAAAGIGTGLWIAATTGEQADDDAAQPQLSVRVMPGGLMLAGTW